MHGHKCNEGQKYYANIMTRLDSIESAARTAGPPMKKFSKPYSQNYNEQIKNQNSKPSKHSKIQYKINFLASA